MFCPTCGTETREPLKFCKKCGTNLKRVQGVMGKGGAGVIAQSPAGWDQLALEEYREERERKKKKTPEEKRYEEIKAGIITSCVGLGVMIFFSFLFNAIANTVEGPEANILRSLWAVGLVPFLIGLGITFNGLIVSKRIIELKRQQVDAAPKPLFSAVPVTAQVPQLTGSSLEPVADFSITEPTTSKLREPTPVPSSRDTN